jgi:hypothetical protein
MEIMKTRKLRVLRNFMEICLRGVAILILLGLFAQGLLMIIDPPSEPKAKDLILAQRLNAEIESGTRRIYLSEFMSDEEVGFAWDEVCRTGASKYPEPVYSNNEWSLYFRRYFGDAIHHKAREGSNYLINPLIFGSGIRKNFNDPSREKTKDQIWCIERAHAVLQITEAVILLMDDRETATEGKEYLKLFWQPQWNNWQ